MITLRYPDLQLILRRKVKVKIMARKWVGIFLCDKSITIIPMVAKIGTDLEAPCLWIDFGSIRSYGLKMSEFLSFPIVSMHFIDIHDHLLLATRLDSY